MKELTISAEWPLREDGRDARVVLISVHSSGGYAGIPEEEVVPEEPSSASRLMCCISERRLDRGCSAMYCRVICMMLCSSGSSIEAVQEAANTKKISAIAGF